MRKRLIIFVIPVLFVLTERFKINYLTASAISFMSGAILNYYLCTLWIFTVRAIKKQHQEFIYYIIITIVGLGINTLIIWFFTQILGLYFMFSKLVAISAVVSSLPSMIREVGLD